MRKKITLGVIAAFLFFFGVGFLLASGTDSRLEERYQAAKQCFRSGDYASAIKAFEEVLRIDPNYKVAVEYVKVARAKSLAKSEQVIALQERLEGLQGAAKKKQEKAAVRESDLSRMKESWQRWLTKEEEKKVMRQEKAKEKAQLKREKELARYYQIDELEKISQQSSQMIAKAEKEKTLQEKNENVIWAKLEALPSPQREKAMARVYMARAEAAYKDGNYEEAVKEWEKAGSIDSANTTAQVRIDKVRRMIEENKIAELTKAKLESISQAKEAHITYCNRGKYLYGHGDYEGSISEFQKALAVNPDSKEAAAGIAKAEKVMKAATLKEEGKRNKLAAKTSALVSKGERYLQQRKYSKARSLALKALELAPDSAEAQGLLRRAEEGLSQK